MSFAEAQLVYSFQPTIPAGSGSYSTDLTFAPAEVVAVVWRVPPGPRGSMGWALGASGQQIIPSNVGEWIVADDEEDTWNLTETVTTGDFTFLGYNNGTYNHQVFLRFLCVPLKAAKELPPWFMNPVPDSELDTPASSSVLVVTRSLDEAIATTDVAVRP